MGLFSRKQTARVQRLIVGLGNPGPAYAGTRHNIGFEVVEHMAARTRTGLGPGRARAIGGVGSWRARTFALAMPQTFMNLSGEAVLGLMRAYALQPEDILVVVDDIALDAGMLRTRPGGSAGGHNGLQHIADLLGTDAYPRLRFGVGRDFPRGRQAQYVLEPFTPAQRALVDEALPVAVEAALTFITDGVQTVMNRYNAFRPQGPEDEKEANPGEDPA